MQSANLLPRKWLRLVCRMPHAGRSGDCKKFNDFIAKLFGLIFRSDRARASCGSAKRACPPTPSAWPQTKSNRFGVKRPARPNGWRAPRAAIRVRACDDGPVDSRARAIFHGVRPPPCAAANRHGHRSSPARSASKCCCTTFGRFVVMPATPQRINSSILLGSSTVRNPHSHSAPLQLGNGVC